MDYAQISCEAMVGSSLICMLSGLPRALQSSTDNVSTSETDIWIPWNHYLHAS